MSGDHHTVVDMMGREVEVPVFPKRIVSLVPSQTELLYDLGLGDRVVGITKFCVHPDKWFRNKKRIGGTKTPKVDEIKALDPDLIIGNKEENDQASIEELGKEFPVWISDIYDYEDALAMIVEVGNLVNASKQAQALVEDLRLSLPTIEKSLSCLYFIWRNPWMLAGKNVFINSMLEKAGFNNLLKDHALMRVHEQNGKNVRYPELSDKELKELDPEVVLLSSEPYPFREKHIQELNSVFPEAQIILVDGELFSWYGSRLKQSGKYFRALQKELVD